MPPHYQYRYIRYNKIVKHELFEVLLYTKVPGIRVPGARYEYTRRCLVPRGLQNRSASAGYPGTRETYRRPYECLPGGTEWSNVHPVFIVFILYPVYRAIGCKNTTFNLNCRNWATTPLHRIRYSTLYTQISPLRKRVNRIHVPFLNWNPHIYHTIVVGQYAWNQVSIHVPFLRRGGS